jgi:hypothetical protein
MSPQHYSLFSKMACVVNQKQIWNDVTVDNGDPVRKVKEKNIWQFMEWGTNLETRRNNKTDYRITKEQG